MVKDFKVSLMALRKLQNVEREIQKAYVLGFFPFMPVRAQAFIWNTVRKSHNKLCDSILQRP